MRSIPEYLLSHFEAEIGVPFLRLLEKDGSCSTFTYREILEQAAAWKQGFAARGLVPGDRVILILKHSPELYASFLGSLLGGYVPALFAFPSPKFSEEEYFKTIGLLIASAGPRVVVAYDDLQSKLEERLGKTPGGAEMLRPSHFAGTASLSLPAKTTDPSTTAFLQYSSGTTGVKKGVEVSHEALIWQVESYAREIGLRNGDSIVSWLPLYHDMGLIACFFLPFLKAVPLTAMSPFDWVQKPVLMADAVSRYRPTLAWMPNFAFSFMARNLSDTELKDKDFSSLRALINCSEPVMAASFDEFESRFSPQGFRSRSLWTCYAMAENTFAVTSGGKDAPPARERVDARAFAAGSAEPAAQDDPLPRIHLSSGKPLPGVAVSIVGEGGRLLPERAVGEIAIAAPCLFSGYLNNPEATAKVLSGERYFTGDLGYLSNGELFVTGRKKDLIIIGGQNIYPQDVEALVNAIPGVIPGRSVALGVPDPETGTERLVILAETSETNPERLVAIRVAIHGEVAAKTDAVPADIRMVAPRWLLKSSSGKISRPGNVEKYKELIATEASHQVGHEELREKVRSAVRKALQTSPSGAGSGLGADTPLFSSGLIDSLSLAALLADLEQSTGKTVPATVSAGTPDFDNVEGIVRTLLHGAEVAKGARLEPEGASQGQAGNGAEDTPPPMHLPDRAPSALGRAGFWTWYYKWLFRRKGIRFGKGLRVLGPILLRLDGDPRNIVIGDGVTLMPMVDIKIRENGNVILHNGVTLDTLVRLVAANDARLELGDGAQVGMGTLINAGADVLIGRRAAIAGYCVIIASEHLISRHAPVMSQGYRHSPVHIGADAWIASQVFVGKGSRIGEGAVISAGSVVTGRVPPFAVWAGRPGRVIKYRS